ncbi:mitochondrial carrier domain-containing protein [Chytridium lagenaria]|nr:mitochondrial carrier domain-containing protein [Chytridium lagenaria]
MSLSPTEEFFRSMLAGGISNMISSSTFLVIENGMALTSGSPLVSCPRFGAQYHRRRKSEIAIQNTSLSKSSSIANPPPLKYRSLSHTAGRIYAEEGIAGLVLPGLLATVFRELIYSSLRFAIYVPIKTGLHNLIADSDKIGKMEQGGEPFIIKLVSGVSSGIIGSSLANPTDVVKIRMQSEAGRVVNGVYVSGLREGHKPTYKNTFNAFYRIALDEGFAGLYRGAGAVTGVQLASYDETKYILKKQGLYKKVSHFTLPPLNRFSPIDFVKSRILAQNSTDPNRYTGVFDCMVRSVKHNGGNPMILFRGWLASYLRLAPHFVIALPLNEWCRKMLGLKAL